MPFKDHVAPLSFIIERTTNANTVVYYLNYSDKAKKLINTELPLASEWIMFAKNADGKEREYVNYIESSLVC